MTNSPFILDEMHCDPRQIVGNGASVRSSKVSDGGHQSQVWQPTIWHHGDKPSDPEAGPQALVVEEIKSQTTLQFDEAEIADLMARAKQTGTEQGRSEVANAIEAQKSQALQAISEAMRDLDCARSNAIQATSEQLKMLLDAALDCLYGTLPAEWSQDKMLASIRHCLERLQGEIDIEIRLPEGLVESIREHIECLAVETGFTGKIEIIAEPKLAPGTVEIDWRNGGLVRSPERLVELIKAEWSQLTEAPHMPTASSETTPQIADDVSTSEKENHDE